MKNTYHIKIKESFLELKSLKKSNERESFREMFMALLPEIKQHITNILATAKKKELLKNKGIGVDDIVNNLYIYVYEHIDKLQNQDDFHVWLFEAIDRQIQEVLIDEEFEDFFFKNIDNYTHQEWDAMEEEYSTYGDGDLVMLDELDDMSLVKDNYVLNKVFVEDTEKKITDKLEKELSNKQIEKHYKMVMSRLPLVTHSVYDLYVFRGFEPKEISKIKRMHLTNVYNLLNQAQQVLKDSFQSRYLK